MQGNTSGGIVSLSHKKHRSTGGPNAVDRGRQNPTEVRNLCREVNKRMQLQKQLRDRLKPPMFATVQEAFARST